MTEKPLPTILELTPLNQAYRDDPHATLDDLRTRCPVHYDAMAGSFVLSRYNDIRPIVSDNTMWRDPLHAEPSAVFQRGLISPEAADLPRGETTSILMLDDPDHGRIRKPLMQALYARVAKFKPHVEAVVDQYLDAIDVSAPFDLMSGFCIPVPIDVIAQILGVSPDRLTEFRDWSEGVIQSLNPFRTDAQTAHMERASAALNDYFLALIEERRAAPRDDLISDMTKLQGEGAPLSDVELRINLSALLIGGNLTTTDLIGNAVRLLLTHPDQLARLRADPELIGAAVEETLRVEGPVDITGRIASRDMEVGGCPVKTSQSVMMFLRAANHDPAVFENPHAFDISREHHPHVAFGGGSHLCIGAPLARLEAKVALARLIERFPNLRLADPDAAPVWRTLPFFRGLERLELRA